MANLKFVLRDRTKQDGSHPIRLRITKGRNVAYLSTEDTVAKSDIYWDDKLGLMKKAFNNHLAFNNRLLKKKLEVAEKILEIEKKNPDFTPQQIVDVLNEKVSNTLLERMLLYQKRFTEGENTYAAVLYNYNMFRNYLGPNKDIPLNQITVSWLESFQQWFKREEYSIRTANSAISYIRTLMIRAVKDRIIAYHENPFNDFKIKKAPSANKIPLSGEELSRIKNLIIPGNAKFSLRHTRNMFLFMYECAGMRVSDALMLKWSNIIDGKSIKYTMIKTKMEMSFELTDDALQILSFYKQGTNQEGYVFPFINSVYRNRPTATISQKIKRATGEMNRYLKKIAKAAEIKKNLSSHVARHSFTQATIDSQTSDYDRKLLLGHHDMKSQEAYKNDGYNIPGISKMIKEITSKKVS